MELSLQMQQSLKLRMTAELRQAINLLQFSATELIEFINEQAEENPLLEIKDQAGFSYNPKPRIRKQISDYEPTENSIENLAVGIDDYIDQLMKEIQWLQLEEKERRILTYLIQSLDERGYLVLDESHAYQTLQCTARQLEAGINRVQSLHPSGIGARSLEECLTLQLHKLQNERKGIALKLVRNLDLVATKNWAQLEKMYQASYHDIKAGAELIKTLNPKPFRGLQINNQIQYVFPDIIVNKKPDKYEVIIDGDLPRVSYNKEYLALSKHDDVTHKYVHEKFKQYKWLQKGLLQRRRTLDSFVQVILQKQNGLMKYGKTHLKPMTMKEIAMEMDVHESTVSRVVKNKYMQTPLGMFLVRDLFTSSIETSTGDFTSSASVKQKIQELILVEDKRNPLSDQKIVERLKQGYGIQISRRTVTKYREQLRILSSTMRKER